MIFFRRTGGFIRAAGLVPWWDQTFSRKEVRIFRATYRPLGAGRGNRCPFFEGESCPDHYVKFPASHIAAVAQWFLSRHHLIAKKLLDRAMKMRDRQPMSFDLYAFYGDAIKGFYRLRDSFPDAKGCATQLAWEMVERADELKKAIEPPDDESLEDWHPLHHGGYRLRIDLGREGLKVERDRLVAELKNKGWTVK